VNGEGVTEGVNEWGGRSGDGRVGGCGRGANRMVKRTMGGGGGRSVRGDGGGGGGLGEMVGRGESGERRGRYGGWRRREGCNEVEDGGEGGGK